MVAATGCCRAGGGTSKYEMLSFAGSTWARVLQSDGKPDMSKNPQHTSKLECKNAISSCGEDCVVDKCGQLKKKKCLSQKRETHKAKVRLGPLHKII